MFVKISQELAMTAADPTEATSSGTHTETTSESDHLPPPPKKFHRLFMDSQQRARAAENSDRPAGSYALTVDMELECYNAEINNQNTESGISFWQDSHRQQSYSLLAPLALDLLAAPASQAYVERVFSVCARKRNRMCRNLEQRAFLKMNRLYIDKI
jgi:hAT family C-terminal dimerisation region